ncbi:MAG: TonB-dependent receptor [Acidobacteria bacterium]|nr:TonB-dependent receptor [Acidobacteriota bacterium]
MKSRLMVLVVVLGLAVALSAQTFRGTILGTVTDASGALVSDANVTVANVNTGQVRTTQTSTDGSYAVPELPIGTYTVTITQSGFQTFVATGVEVNVASERRVDAALKPGQVAQKVEVSADILPQVETTSTVLGGILTPQVIEHLPVNGRDYTKLIYLNPGVAGSPDQISDSPGSFGIFSMNGSRGRANNFLLDGTDMNDGFRNDPAINEAGVFGDPATILPVEAVAELRVLSNYEAEYGRNSGAIVNIVTKSGTNTWHGSLLEYNRTSSVGGARNFFNSVGAQDPFHNNQFGGSLGGPIVKDKTFFYVNYEGQRESGAQSGQSCVPDPRQIALDIANNGPANPVIAALLARNPYPAPNIVVPYDPLDPDFDTGCPTGNNLAISTRFSNRVDSMIAKVDHNFNPKNLLTGRYYFGDSDQSFPFAQLAGGLLPGFNTTTPTRVQLVSISYVRVVSATQVNEARLGWVRYVQGFFPEDSDFNPSTIGLNTGVTSPYDFGLPKISLAGFSVIGATNSIPRSRVDSNWHFVDNYSWKSGRHDIKFGYEFRRTTIQLIQNNTFRGRLSFDDLSSFLQGLPDDGKLVQGNTRRHSFENSHGFYVQDSLRWTPRLTLNLGLRWDYFGVPGEKDDLFFRFDPTGAGALVPTGQLYEKDYNNFAPRVAFAYDVTGEGKTVIRAGWGLFYDAFAQDIFLAHVPYNCAFCPGPALTGEGPFPIGSAGLRLVPPPAPPADPATVPPLDPTMPVFSGFSPLSDFFGIDPQIRTPYTQNFNLNVQQQFGGAVLQIGYVGARGTKLFRFRDINQPSQADITAFDTSTAAGGQCFGLVAPNCPIAGFDGPDNVNFNVPRPFGDFFYVNLEESSASSTYHSLQASLRINSWHGLTSAANFVWSHSIDNASDSEDFIPNAAQPNNSLAPQLERGNSNFDIRRRFTWNFAYEFPRFGGGWSRLKNGWGLDGVLSLQDGQPFQLNYNFEGDYSGSGEGFDRPDVVGPIIYGTGPFSVDLSSFQVPCTFGNTTVLDPGDNPTGDSNCQAGTRHFGNLGRNSLRGPSFKEFNFAVFKNTALTERVKLQLRFEFFNLFNHPNFSNPFLPNFITDPANNGLDAAGRGIGFLPLTATGDVGIGNPFLGGGGPRGVQFAAKITF